MLRDLAFEQAYYFPLFLEFARLAIKLKKTLEILV